MVMISRAHVSLLSQIPVLLRREESLIEAIGSYDESASAGESLSVQRSRDIALLQRVLRSVVEKKKIASERKASIMADYRRRRESGIDAAAAQAAQEMEGGEAGAVVARGKAPPGWEGPWPLQWPDPPLANWQDWRYDSNRRWLSALRFRHGLIKSVFKTLRDEEEREYEGPVDEDGIAAPEVLEATVARWRPPYDRSREDKIFISFDRLLSPELYTADRLSEEDRDAFAAERIYTSPLSESRLRLISSLPSRLTEAIPWLETREELRAHAVLNKYRRSGGDDARYRDAHSFIDFAGYSACLRGFLARHIPEFARSREEQEFVLLDSTLRPQLYTRYKPPRKRTNRFQRAKEDWSWMGLIGVDVEPAVIAKLWPRWVSSLWRRTDGVTVKHTTAEELDRRNAELWRRRHEAEMLEQELGRQEEEGLKEAEEDSDGTSASSSVNLDSESEEEEDVQSQHGSASVLSTSRSTLTISTAAPKPLHGRLSSPVSSRLGSPMARTRFATEASRPSSSQSHGEAEVMLVNVDGQLDDDVDEEVEEGSQESFPQTRTSSYLKSKFMYLVEMRKAKDETLRQGERARKAVAKQKKRQGGRPKLRLDVESSPKPSEGSSSDDEVDEEEDDEGIGPLLDIPGIQKVRTTKSISTVNSKFSFRATRDVTRERLAELMDLDWGKLKDERQMRMKLLLTMYGADGGEGARRLAEASRLEVVEDVGDVSAAFAAMYAALRAANLPQLMKLLASSLVEAAKGLRKREEEGEALTLWNLCVPGIAHGLPYFIAQVRDVARANDRLEESEGAWLDFDWGQEGGKVAAEVMEILEGEGETLQKPPRTSPTGSPHGLFSAQSLFSMQAKSSEEEDKNVEDIQQLGEAIAALVHWRRKQVSAAPAAALVSLVPCITSSKQTVELVHEVGEELKRREIKQIWFDVPGCLASLHLGSSFNVTARDVVFRDEAVSHVHEFEAATARARSARSMGEVGTQRSDLPTARNPVGPRQRDKERAKEEGKPLPQPSQIPCIVDITCVITAKISRSHPGREARPPRVTAGLFWVPEPQLYERQQRAQWGEEEDEGLERPWTSASVSSRPQTSASSVNESEDGTRQAQLRSAEAIVASNRIPVGYTIAEDVHLAEEEDEVVSASCGDSICPHMFLSIWLSPSLTIPTSILLCASLSLSPPVSVFIIFSPLSLLFLLPLVPLFSVVLSRFLLVVVENAVAFVSFSLTMIPFLPIPAGDLHQARATAVAGHPGPIYVGGRCSWGNCL